VGSELVSYEKIIVTSKREREREREREKKIIKKNSHV